MPLPENTIKSVLYNWISASSGVAVGKIIFDGQSAPLPSGTFIKIKHFFNAEPVGQDESSFDDGLVETKAYRHVTASITAFGPGAFMALSKANSALRKESIIRLFEAGEIGINDYGRVRQWTIQEANREYEAAQFDLIISCYEVDEEPEDFGYFESVGTVQDYSYGSPDANHPPVKVTILKKNSNTVRANQALSITETSFIASWEPVSNSVSYEIEIATDREFKNLVKNQVLTGEELLVTELNEGQTYFYRIKSFNGSNYTDWSNIVSASTSDYIFLHLFSENDGLTVGDSSFTPDNPAEINLSAGSDYYIFHHAFTESSGLSISDISTKNNDSNITDAPITVDDSILFQLLFTESSGLSISDSSPAGYENDFIISSAA